MLDLVARQNKNDFVSEQTRIKGEAWSTLKWRVMLSDKTVVLGRFWRDVKEEAMRPDYMFPE